MALVNEWVAKQVAAFRSLVDKTVVGWVGVEMALRERGPSDLPQFEDHTIRFLQLTVLYVNVDNEIVCIGTYPRNDSWGLCIDCEHSILLPPFERVESIFRTRDLSELPRGSIKGVESLLDTLGDLIEITLCFADATVVLRAGEVHEESDGNLRIITPDESILVSVGPAIARVDLR